MKLDVPVVVYIGSDCENFFKELLEKYPKDYVDGSVISYLIRNVGDLKYSYTIDELTDDDKKWFIDFIESALEAEYEAEMAAAEAEAEAQAIAESEAAMFEQMMMEEESRFNGPYDY